MRCWIDQAIDPDLTACDRIGSPVRRQRSAINGFDRDVGWSVDTQ
jgi:hypothetical protein